MLGTFFSDMKKETAETVADAVRLVFGGKETAPKHVEWHCPGDSCAVCAGKEGGVHKKELVVWLCQDNKTITAQAGLDGDGCVMCGVKIRRETNDLYYQECEQAWGTHCANQSDDPSQTSPFSKGAWEAFANSPAFAQAAKAVDARHTILTPEDYVAANGVFKAREADYLHRVPDGLDFKHSNEHAKGVEQVRAMGKLHACNSRNMMGVVRDLRHVKCCMLHLKLDVCNNQWNQTILPIVTHLELSSGNGIQKLCEALRAADLAWAANKLEGLYDKDLESRKLKKKREDEGAAWQDDDWKADSIPCASQLKQLVADYVKACCSTAPKREAEMVNLCQLPAKNSKEKAKVTWPKCGKGAAARQQLLLTRALEDACAGTLVAHHGQDKLVPRLNFRHLMTAASNSTSRLATNVDISAISCSLNQMRLRGSAVSAMIKEAFSFLGRDVQKLIAGGYKTIIKHLNVNRTEYVARAGVVVKKAQNELLKLEARLDEVTADEAKQAGSEDVPADQLADVDTDVAALCQNIVEKKEEVQGHQDELAQVASLAGTIKMPLHASCTTALQDWDLLAAVLNPLFGEEYSTETVEGGHTKRMLKYYMHHVREYRSCRGKYIHYLQAHCQEDIRWIHGLGYGMTLATFSVGVLRCAEVLACPAAKSACREHARSRGASRTDPPPPLFFFYPTHTRTHAHALTCNRHSDQSIATSCTSCRCATFSAFLESTRKTPSANTPWSTSCWTALCVFAITRGASLPHVLARQQSLRWVLC